MGGSRNEESHAYLAFNRGDIMQNNAATEDRDLHRPVTRPPSPYRQPLASRPPSPGRPFVRFMDPLVPRVYDRNVLYVYDRRDTNIPRTNISANGQIVAPPQLSYAQPRSILQKPETYGAPRESRAPSPRSRLTSPG